MERSYIKDLKPENKEIFIEGFIEKVRDQKYMQFIVIRDITGKVQVTVEKEGLPKVAEVFSALIADCVVAIKGKVVANANVKLGGIEIIPSEVEVLSMAEETPIKEDSSIDKRIDYRWVDLRTEKNALIFKVRTQMMKSMRNFLYTKGFMEINSPKIIAAASESGSDVFELKYFNRKAYLCQSPQFYKQMAMAAGFERMFEVGPVFRAENSNTSRHATEFTGFDIEMSYIRDYAELMTFEAEWLTFMLKEMKDVYGDDIKRVFGVDVVVPTLPMPVMKLADLYKEAEKYDYTVPAGAKIDTTTELEKLSYRIATEKFNSEFLFVTDFGAKKRAFYHMRKDGIPQGYDLIWKGVEITTGAQREHRYDILKEQAKEKKLDKDIEFYLEFFKYGCPPHGGMGLGIDRLVMLLLNLPSLKESMFIFRGPDRLTP